MRPLVRVMFKRPKANIKDTRYEGEDWIKLAQNKSQWRAFVNRVI
jgi:hypothetical protein